MALPHRSIATTDGIEIINLQPMDINPLMSECQIKVMYVGENRNGSYISRETMTEMAKTLRGCPIVGYYKESKEDFADHGHRVTFDDEGIHFETLTRPYGFVAPNAEVWFQKFEDEDDFGNVEVHEYLVTNGFLWTKQFEEAGLPLNDGGRPHSMELDEDSLQGHWAENSKNGLEFFIISDAIFSKLCILGEDVEPCYEGSSIGTPVRTQFNLSDNNNDFVKTLSTMMTDLQFALKAKGEEAMAKPVNTEANLDTSVQANATNIQNNVDDNTSFSAEQNQETEIPTTEHAAEQTQETVSTSEFKEEEKDGNTNGKGEEKEKDNDKIDHSLNDEIAALKVEFAKLQESFTALQNENNALNEFKTNVEDTAKDDMIANEFYMLSNEDKADVIAHKSEYSLDEIKSKLALICFEKKVAFEAPKASATEAKQPTVTFSLNANDDAGIPDWAKAVQENM